VEQLAGTVVATTIAGQDVRFFVVDPADIIQRWHARGAFYEAEELAIIAEFFPRGGVFVDIGSNVGNHTIYVCKYLHPTQAILFEPNPPAIAILRINLALNGLQRLVDLTHLGIGLSDAAGRANASTPPRNLGGARLHMARDGEGLTLARGDDVLLQRRVDFIKIDVEGMELRVLKGLAATVARWRPPMFIEVENGNAAGFAEWLAANGYAIVRSHRRYAANENHMVVPAGR
jgi:FkbM family methyltransferase